MKIKALKPFTVGDLSLSLGMSQVAEVSSTLGNSLISAGLAEEYKMLTPTGEVSITENGSVDVGQYATAVVNVGIYTVSYDANGGTGTISAGTVIAGNSLELSDGTGLAAPEGKSFSGWASASVATESDITSPYTPTGNTTVYAVWGDA